MDPLAKNLIGIMTLPVISDRAPDIYLSRLTFSFGIFACFLYFVSG
jgi:hypothetical protein